MQSNESFAESEVLKSMFLLQQCWSTACDWLKALLWDVTLVTLLQSWSVRVAIPPESSGCLFPDKVRINAAATIGPSWEYAQGTFSDRLKQCGIQGFPNSSTQCQHWESHRRPSDPETNALTIWPHFPIISCKRGTSMTASKCTTHHKVCSVLYAFSRFMIMTGIYYEHSEQLNNIFKAFMTLRNVRKAKQ